MKEKKNVKCTGKRGKKLWNRAIPYFSMLMIVILHINMNGGLMGCFPNVDAKYTTLWFGETFCFASVNCYALISGYVMYNHKATAGKLLNM